MCKGSKDNPYGYDEDEKNMDEQEVESLAKIMFDDSKDEEKSEKNEDEEDEAAEITGPEEKTEEEKKSGWLRNLFRRGSVSKDDGNKSVSSVKTPMTTEQLHEMIRNNPEVDKNIIYITRKMFFVHELRCDENIE